MAASVSYTHLDVYKRQVDDKHAYIVGSGLASLAAACFLVRDGQMPGKNIHILEAMDIAGGACLLYTSSAGI